MFESPYKNKGLVNVSFESSSKMQYVYWNINNLQLHNNTSIRMFRGSPIRPEQETKPNRDPVLQGQKVKILIRSYKRKLHTFWVPTKHRNVQSRDHLVTLEISIEWPAELPAESFPSRRISKFTVQA